jgi:HD-like signal output (HDOD) protein
VKGWFRSLFARPPARRAPRAVTRPPVTTAVPTERTLSTDDVIAAVGAMAARVPDPAVVAAIEARILAELEAELVIPPFPASATRVLELVNKADLDLTELVRVLAWEPPVVAEIVRVASSVAVRRDGFDDLRGALIALGMAEVGSIAASVSARSLFELQARAELALFPDRWMAVHRDALIVAFTASWLAQARNLPRYDRVFLRGVIAGTAPMLALRALAVQLIDGRVAMPPAEELSAAIDLVRGRAFELALARWNLPPAVASVVDPASRTEHAIVELVTGLIALRRHPDRTVTALAVRDHARALGLDAKWLHVLVGECDAAAARVSAILAPPEPLRATGSRRAINR